MRASAVSFTHTLTAAVLAVLLTFSLVPFAYAEGEGVSEDDVETIASGFPDQPNDSADSVILSEGAEGPEVEESNKESLTLASGLVGAPSNFINSDVAFDSEPIIGSFTVDGLTYAVIDGPYVELVGVSPDRQQVTNSQEGEGSGVALMLASGSDRVEVNASTLALPETVSYEGVSHIVSSIGAYAFYLSGVTSVTLPASVNDVDDRAFRSSDMANVIVAEGNPSYSSFDGALYDAFQSSLLLIPEGKQGTVRIPKTAETVEASVFSHCSLVNAISVDAGSAAFASENGLLYTSDLTTLLRVPAGATEVTIREGCTTIAAGALEACAKLTTINAPTSVNSISPDVFTAIPTVSLLAASLIGTDDPGASGEPFSQDPVPQLSAVVALSTTDNGLPEVDLETITVWMPKGTDAVAWCSVGLNNIKESADLPSAQFQSASSYAINVGLYTSIAVKALYTAYYADVRQEQRYVSFPANSYIFNSSGFRLMNITSGYYTQFIKSIGSTQEQYDYSNFASTTVGAYIYKLSSGHNGSFYWDAAQTRWASPGNYTTDGIIYLGWRYTNYAISYDSNGGSLCASASGNITQNILMPAPTRVGYDFIGWEVGDATFQAGTLVNIGTLASKAGCQADKVTDSISLTARWAVSNITIGWDSQGGSLIADTSALYSPTAKVPMPATNPTKAGYTFAGWWTDPTGGTQVTASTALPTESKTYYAHWSLNPYAITYDLAGGSVSGNPTTYDVTTTAFTLKNPTKQGYIFAGWSGTGLAGSANKEVTIAQGSTGDRAYTAHWEPRISADVSRYVTLQLDILGMEGTPPAQGAIRSLCGEPLKVASVSFSPDQGAAELFGDNRKGVSVEGIAGAGASPGFSFPLDASVAEEADPTKLSAFTMAPLGTLDVAYRLSIAPDLREAILAAIDSARFEGKTTSVCSVAYTVALVS